MSQKILFWKYDAVYNLLGPRDPQKRQWTLSSLVQVMVSRLLGANTLLEFVLPYSQLVRWEKLQININRNSLQQNAFKKNTLENIVYEMVAIFSRLR